MWRNSLVSIVGSITLFAGLPITSFCAPVDTPAASTTTASTIHSTLGGTYVKSCRDCENAPNEQCGTNGFELKCGKCKTGKRLPSRLEAGTQICWNKCSADANNVKKVWNHNGTLNCGDG